MVLEVFLCCKLQSDLLVILSLVSLGNGRNILPSGFCNVRRGSDPDSEKRGPAVGNATSINLDEADQISDVFFLMFAD